MSAPRLIQVDTADAVIRSCEFLGEVARALGARWTEEPAVMIWSDGTVQQGVLHDARRVICGAGGRRAEDHLGPEGKYFVDYMAGQDDVRSAGPFGIEEEAQTAATQLDAAKFPVTAIYETAPDGRIEIIWSRESS